MQAIAEARRVWSQSVLLRLGVAMGAIALLALASILGSTLFTERSEGKAGAINIAGSLRMQSWSIVAALGDAAAGAPERNARIENGLAGFESRLASPLLLAGLADAPRARAAYDAVADEWHRDIRARLQAAAADPARLAAALDEMPAFVATIDRLVLLLEQDLEERIRALRFWQGLALFLILACIVCAMYLMHTQVIEPLDDLLDCARTVRGGGFDVRATVRRADELGQLGEAFNTMIGDLALVYRDLEQRVADKTEALARSNRSLELLYGTTRTLSERGASEDSLRAVLGEVERVLGARAGVICAHEPGQAAGFPIAVSAPGLDGGPHLCGAGRCASCFGAHAQVETAEGLRISVPLVYGGRTWGVMPLAFAPGTRLEPWQTRLAEEVGRQIGAALAGARRIEQRHRLALLEERSVIARELHDSLAQSLAYLKIQLTRLQAQLGETARHGAAGEVVNELRGGLNNAYRQLRELLTTFRLRIEGRGIGEALAATVRDFERRSGIAVKLENGLLGVELSANEEIHVLQVIREALSNVEHHSGAQQAEVRLARDPDGRLRVRIADDGRGIGEGAAPLHHYGIAIMRDRAASLGGSLDVARRRRGGTRVELVFMPASPFATPAGIAA